MTVADVMTRDVEFIAADASAQDAAELMGELDVGALPVGSAERLLGIITDRDILYRVVARGLDPAATRMREICSRPVVACRPADPLTAAMDMMASHHVRRLPVQDPDTGAIIGWVTLADISRRLLVTNPTLQSALRTLTEP